MFAHNPRHGLHYPENDLDAHLDTWHRKLDLTPSTARELVLLADLVGWAVFAPILLDMASRPGECSFKDCSWSWRQSGDLDRVWGGFEALKVLSSEYERLSHALTLCMLFLQLYSWPCREGSWTRQPAVGASSASNGSRCCAGSIHKRQQAICCGKGACL